MTPSVDVAPSKLALGAVEAAAALGVSERHLLALAKRGEVPSVRLGQRIVFPVNVLNDWLRSRCGQWLPAAAPEGGDG